jgi:hypothetical protein
LVSTEVAMLQGRLVRGASAAIHVVFIALLLWFAWVAFPSREPNFDDETGAINRLFATVAAAIATLMALGLILWLKRGRIELLLIPDNVLLVLFGFGLSLHIEAVFLACFLALVAAEAPVLTDRRSQLSTPRGYSPGYSPGAPPNPPRATGSNERPAPPPPT